jgi:hypothetical protein
MSTHHARRVCPVMNPSSLACHHTCAALIYHSCQCIVIILLTVSCLLIVLVCWHVVLLLDRATAGAADVVCWRVQLDRRRRLIITKQGHACMIGHQACQRESKGELACRGCRCKSRHDMHIISCAEQSMHACSSTPLTGVLIAWMLRTHTSFALCQ